MAVTSAALAVAVGISLAVLEAYATASARTSLAQRLAQGLRVAAQQAQRLGGTGLASHDVREWYRRLGGTLELTDARGHVFWRVGPALQGAWAAWEKHPLGKPPSGALEAARQAVRVRDLAQPMELLWVAPVNPPRFPDPLERGVLVSGLCAAFLAEVLWAVLARRLTRPLEELLLALDRYGKGDFRLRPRVKGPREWAVLAEAVDRMASALEEERQARETFLAEVAHDLRTPLTALRGFLASMEGAVPPSQREPLVRAQREAERLTRLVNDLLDLARYEAGHLHVPLRRLDLREIALVGVFPAQAQAQGRGLKLSLDMPPQEVWVWGNLDRGVQILVNLVDNALRYTPPGGQVRVRVGREGPWGAVWVEDTGPGFGPQAAQWTWSAFTRGKAARESDGGTGLGLAIGRALATAMEGELGILPPQEGMGGRVVLRLPAAGEAPSPKAAALPPT
jgi:signal transduction histidine kinase